MITSFLFGHLLEFQHYFLSCCHPLKHFTKTVFCYSFAINIRLHSNLSYEKNCSFLSEMDVFLATIHIFSTLLTLALFTFGFLYQQTTRLLRFLHHTLVLTTHSFSKHCLHSFSRLQKQSSSSLYYLHCSTSWLINRKLHFALSFTKISAIYYQLNIFYLYF